jgi:hypothetical protein
MGQVIILPTPNRPTNDSLRRSSTKFGARYEHNRLCNTLTSCAKLLTDLYIQLPYHSGRTILQLETDPSLQHVVETLVDAGKERLDRVAWSLTELTHNVFKVRQNILTIGTVCNNVLPGYTTSIWRRILHGASHISFICPQSPLHGDGSPLGRLY